MTTRGTGSTRSSVARRDGVPVPVPVPDARAQPAPAPGHTWSDAFWELASDLLAVCDLQGRLLTFNPAWERVLGWTRHELATRPVTDFLHPEDAEAAARDLARAAGPAARIERREHRWRHADGTYRRISWSGVAGGGTSCVVGTDVSRLERDQDRLGASRRALREAGRVAGLSSWEWLIEADRVVVDAGPLTTAVGLDTTAELRLDDLLETIVASDRAAVVTELRALSSGWREGATFEHRVTDTAGHVLWFEAHCRLVRDAEGRPVAIRGIGQDVTARRRTLEDLETARDFLQATLDALPASVAVLDEAGVIVAVNAGWRRLGAANGGRGSGVGEDYLAACDAASPDASALAAAAGIRDVLAGRHARFELPYPCGDRWLMLRATRFAAPGPMRVVVVHDDITDRRVAQSQAFAQAALLDEVDVSVIATDDAGLVTHWNRGAQKLYGWTGAEATGRPIGGLVVPEPGAPRTADVLAELRRTGRWEGRFTVRRRDGTTFPAHVRDTVMRDAAGASVGVIGVSMDVTADMLAARTLTAARNHLGAVTDSMGEGLLALDLDGRITLANQAAVRMLGWAQDELQGELMHQLVHHRHPDGSAFPADECPILQTLQTRDHGAVVRIDDDVFVRRDGGDLAVAYTAAPLESADGIGGCVVVFSDISARKAEDARLRGELHTMSWIHRIRAALDEGRFSLHAQPILDLVTDEVVQRELLLRMSDPDGALVAPGAYLKVAEDHGLIGDIDRWVIGQAAAIAARGLAVELNVSARSVGEPGLIAHIESCLEETGADPTRLVFEITETAIVEDEAAALRFAQQLHVLGCGFALDDFGTGYGGFTYLKRLPVDYLKIDTEFVGDLVVNPSSRHVVEAVVSLARGFGALTIAEGVEDAATLDLLRTLGVDFAQGFHLGRPAPLADDGGPAPAAERRR